MEIKVSIGANIKKRRFEMKMSQQDLADAMGYKTRSTIAKIESGENDVSQKKLQKFALVLDTTVEALISGYNTSHSLFDVTLEKSSSTRNKNAVIILAGGKSGRNRQSIPSQFINVHGKPIIAYCMSAYQSHPAVNDIYIVCLKGWESIVQAYAEQYGITKLKGLVPAGNSGISSLKNAINHIKDLYLKDDLIIIQEATRPMVSTELISKLIQAASENGSATVCHSMDDYVQFNMSGYKPKYIDRKSVIALQSPEAHRLSLLCEVLDRAEKSGHQMVETCCTMLFYNMGYNINFIEGGINNIKIVREEDIAAFGALAKVEFSI